MVGGPDGSETKNDCAGEAQQQLTSLLRALGRVSGPKVKEVNLTKEWIHFVIRSALIDIFRLASLV
jgi:hypothetical protein